jgi:hypothetical protein
MRINSGKAWKIPRKIWSAPIRIFETFALMNTQMHRHECNTHIRPFFNFKKTIKALSYNTFPVKKINVGKNLKL